MVTPDRLTQCDFFQPMERAVLDSLSRYFDVQEYKTGEVVFEEGAPGTHLYIIERGALEVIKGAITGEQRPLAELRPGEVVGEMAVMDLRPRSATVRAKTHAALLAVSRDNLLKMLAEEPRAAAALLLQMGQALSERLRLSSARLL